MQIQFIVVSPQNIHITSYKIQWIKCSAVVLLTTQNECKVLSRIFSSTCCSFYPLILHLSYILKHRKMTFSHPIFPSPFPHPHLVLGPIATNSRIVAFTPI